MEKNFRLKPGSFMAPCDFCSTKLAVLFCKADSAKLCLLCDRQVHSANALSLRHLRSQICENCGSEPVSVFCCTENLLFCQDCDWDSHSNCSVSSLHQRSPVEGFSGCPSVIELATFFDFDRHAENLTNLGSGSGFYEPNSLNLEELPVQKQSGPVFVNCEKHKQEVCEQLMEMSMGDLVKFNGDRDELGPGTPPSKCCLQCNMESLEVENFEEELMHHQTPFTSLLTLPNHMDMRDFDCCVSDGHLMWDCNPEYQVTQLQNHSSQHQLLSSGTPTTNESNNTPIIGRPSEFSPVESKIWESADLFQATHDSILNASVEAKGAKTKVDMELFALNRGNAMLRYREKKKYRRYDNHIRYESRKARADTRKRVKGRFVKASKTSDVEL